MALMANPCLLVVEDERPLLALLSKYLERQSYEVLKAETGAEALARLTEARGRVGVVVLDLNLPDMSGQEVLETMLRTDEQVKVVISSGSPWSGEGLRPEWRKRVTSVMKPYVPQQLLQAITGLGAGVRGAGA
jgi:CheY-like chemotaxis protein